jgi:hypothetical protein
MFNNSQRLLVRRVAITSALPRRGGAAQHRRGYVATMGGKWARRTTTTTIDASVPRVVGATRSVDLWGAKKGPFVRVPDLDSRGDFRGPRRDGLHGKESTRHAHASWSRFSVGPRFHPAPSHRSLRANRATCLAGSGSPPKRASQRAARVPASRAARIPAGLRAACVSAGLRAARVSAGLRAGRLPARLRDTARQPRRRARQRAERQLRIQWTAWKASSATRSSIRSST